MIPLHGIRCIDYPADMFRILEVCAEAFPVVPPALDDNWIVLAPLVFQGVQGVFCRLPVDCLIDQLEVFHESLLVFAGDIFDGVAYLMHDAQLHGRVRKDACYGIGKTFETVYAGDKYVPDATALEIGQDTQPEVCAFAFGYVHTQQLLSAIG